MKNSKKHSKIRKMLSKLIKPTISTPKYKKSISKSLNSLNAIIAYNQVAGYSIPTSSIHRPPSQKILRGKLYEKNTINYINENWIDGDVIHAGANFGEFLPSLSKEKKGLIWAFEPNEESFRCCQITILINKIENNVKVYQYGLGDKEETKTLIDKSSTGLPIGSGSYFFDSIKNKYGLKEGQKTSIRTLDNIIPKNRKVSVIHLDLEGYEEKALLGAYGIIERSKPILILENAFSNTNIIKYIEEFGYYHETTLDGNDIFKNKK